MEKEIAFVLALIQQSKMVKYDINEIGFLIQTISYLHRQQQ
jgi:hypothetical protein